MKKSNKRKIILSFASACAMSIAGAALAINTISTSAQSAIEGKGTINVYLVAGSSNAVGYGYDENNELAQSNEKYTSGFDNVLYYGVHERKSGFATDEEFESVTLGLGQTAKQSGIEIGIASALEESEEMHAVIKCAWGPSYLYHDTSANVSLTQGTWTSPTYIEENNINVSGVNKNVGAMYNRFIETVSSGLAMLEADGYTPVVQGMYWMQGEAEMHSETMAIKYEALLTTFIDDVREDLSAVTRADCSQIPFVMGIPTYNEDLLSSTNVSVTDDSEATVFAPNNVIAVQTAINNVANSGNLTNVYALSMKDLPQQDSWQFTASAQKTLGENFISAIESANEGKNGTFKESIAMFNGAKVRTYEPSGLKFGAKIANYNPENGYTYGMIILPSDYLKTYAVTGDYIASFEKAFENTSKKIGVADCAVSYGDFDNDGYKEHFIQATIINFQYGNLYRPYTGIAYIKDADGNYLYTSSTVQRSISYVASAAMIYDYEKTDYEYEVMMHYVSGAVNRKNKVAVEDALNAETGRYNTSDFAIDVETKITIDKNVDRAIGITQIPEMDFATRYTSSDKSIVKVDKEGNLTGINPGTATVTVDCAYMSASVDVTVDPAPKLDGKIESSYYGTKYMHYQTTDETISSSGYADIFVYTYEGNNATYVALEVIGATRISDTRGGVIFMVKNPEGDGKYFRAYANGTVKVNDLANLAEYNNGYKNKVDYLGSDGGVNYMKSTYDAVSSESQVSNRFILEFRLDHKEYLVDNSNELLLSLGWIGTNGTEWVYAKNNTIPELITIDNANNMRYSAIATDNYGEYWWSMSEINARKETDTNDIRLDGYVDNAYTNHFTYTTTTKCNHKDTGKPIPAETTETTLYWYETKDSLYLAFDVTDFYRTDQDYRVLANGAPGEDGTIEYGTPGTAGINFAVTKKGTLENGMWYRAFGSYSQRKALTQIEKWDDLMTAMIGRTDYIRGSEGAIYGEERREDIYSYTVEVRIDYATYGASSADEIQILFGGMQNAYYGDWFYAKDDSSFLFIDTSTKGGAHDRLVDINNTNYNFWWTLEDFVTKMNAQNPIPTLDGKIDSYYGEAYMHYQTNIADAKNGYADAFVYTYVGNASTYVAVEVVGATYITDSQGGIIFMVKAPNGTGKYFRAYANGTVKSNTLDSLKNNQPWNGMTTETETEYLKATYEKPSEVAQVSNKFILEFRVDHETYGINNANELSYGLGWIGTNGTEWIYKYDHAGERMERMAHEKATVLYPSVVNDTTGDYWWTLEEIKERQETDTKDIRLDGYVDDTYQYNFEYEATTISDGTDTEGNAIKISETTKTKIYWYETEESLYLAFDVIGYERDDFDKPWRAIQNTSSGTQGSAGINFAVSKADELNGYWYRATATNSQWKDLASIAQYNDLYNTSFGRTDFIRGNQGAIYNASERREDVYAYTIEVRIDYADYGVKSADELAIIVGGQQNAYMGDWFYGRDDNHFLFTNTGSEGGAYLILEDVSNTNYWWTVPEFEAKAKLHEVQFVNEDGTVLQSELLAYNAMPTYKGETPTKLVDAQYTYTFVGWDKELSVVRSAVTYTATYTKTVNQYTVMFKNEDGSVLQESEIEYGAMPVYEGATPTKPVDKENYIFYEFAGWNPEITAVDYHVAYTATYDEIPFDVTVDENIDVKPNDSKKLNVVQRPYEYFDIKYQSLDEKIATVSADGTVTGVKKGMTTITVTCGNQVRTVAIYVDNPPVLDGKIDESIYGKSYMKYSAGSFTHTGGYADVYVYSYAGEEAAYLAINVVGPTKITNELGGIMFGVRNNNWTDNEDGGDYNGYWEGKYYRAFGNGTTRWMSLQNMAKNNNHYTGMTSEGSTVDDMKATYAGNGVNGYYNSFILEWEINYKEFNAQSADDLAFVLGWIGQNKTQYVLRTDSNTVVQADGNGDNQRSRAIAMDQSDLYWWSMSAIEARKATDTEEIRLDGLLDSTYVNNFTYTATTGKDNEVTTTKFYWYEGQDALYMAFDVTAGMDRTIENKDGTIGGSAGISFAVAGANNTDGTLNGRWHRATGAISFYKDLQTIKTSTDLYGTSKERLEYVRSSEEAIRGVEKRNVRTFLIEVKIEYADYGVESADELKVIIGGLQNASVGDWFYGKDGSSFCNGGDTSTNGGTYLRLQDVNNEEYQFWWTVADFEAEMAKQNAQ